ncbi:hypothetical protein [Bosea minatitlanensis]|uniref:Uncharacterized protein n=1 Tax=Bosea minatitlanensis TaxID=128782 RepID=A0ABW0EW14_9HYPH|nr:hypothetical protein [Bosea minatitlanensis]MCT4496045.1 hypothetical protein [Bosea minatitlanensis]
MSGNHIGGVAVNMATQFRIYERLPAEIRRVVAAAPYKYELAGIERQLREHRREGGNVTSYRRHMIGWICAGMMRSVRKTYGPEHPDAERSRLERRP